MRARSLQQEYYIIGVPFIHWKFLYVLTYAAFIRLTISVLKIFFLHLTWESLSQRSPTKYLRYTYCAEQMNFHSRNLYSQYKKAQPLVSYLVGFFFLKTDINNTYSYTYLQWTCFDIKIISRAQLIKKNEIFITYTFR